MRVLNLFNQEHLTVTFNILLTEANVLKPYSTGCAVGLRGHTQQQWPQSLPGCKVVKYCLIPVL